MNRRLRPTKSTQQIKEEQINFLLEDVEKKLEEYKKATELKNQQLADIKKILQSAKKSNDSVVQLNNEKNILKILNIDTNNISNSSSEITLKKKENILSESHKKNIKKLCTKRNLIVNLK